MSLSTLQEAVYFRKRKDNKSVARGLEEGLTLLSNFSVFSLLNIEVFLIKHSVYNQVTYLLGLQLIISIVL